MKKLKLITEPPMRFPTADSIDYLDSVLQIDKNRYSQDWEIEIADPTRLEEFLDVYENQTRNDDDRFTLMALIVCSFEDSTADGINTELWQRIRRFLLSDFLLHQYTILYWCNAEETDPDNVWTITPLMRGVWNEGIAS